MSEETEIEHESSTVKVSRPLGQKALRQAATGEQGGPNNEKLAEIVDRALYTVGMRLPTKGYDSLLHRANAKARNAKGFSSSEYEIFEALAEPYETGNYGNEEEERRFNERGITEVATLFPGTSVFGDRASSVSMLHYKTLVKHGDKYKYEPGGDDRRGQYFSYSIVLPNKIAHFLWAELQSYPRLLREMGEMMATSPDVVDHERRFQDHPHGQSVSSEQWQQSYRPPFEKWAAINGGVNRVAFRTEFTQGPDEATVVEF